MAFLLRHALQVGDANVSVYEETNFVRDLFKTVYVMDVHLSRPCNAVADNVTVMMSQLLNTFGLIDNNLGKNRIVIAD